MTVLVLVMGVMIFVGNDRLRRMPYLHPRFLLFLPCRGSL